MIVPYKNGAMNPICSNIVAARKFSFGSCWEPLLQATLWRVLTKASICNEGHLWFTIPTSIYSFNQSLHFSHLFYSLLFLTFPSTFICLSYRLLLSSCVPVITCLSTLSTNNCMYLLSYLPVYWCFWLKEGGRLPEAGSWLVIGWELAGSDCSQKCFGWKGKF